MRNIRFRAWDKKGRFDMADVLIIDFHEKYVIVNDGWNKDPETGEEDCVANFDEIELMQFTGLKDKNGKEVYEGDILWYRTDHTDKERRPNWHGNSRKKVVEWVSSKKKIGFNFCQSNNYEVIGNIYSNPELLEK
jgi:uncharacterized phage protein (TIGR01671 family)